MAILNREVRAIQNPALGSTLIWRTASLYRKSHLMAASMPLPLAFLVLPILFHEQTAEMVRSTRIASGLDKLTDKFRSAEFSRTDLLLSVGPRAAQMRHLTWTAMRLGTLSNLFLIDTAEATVVATSDTPHVSGVPDSIRSMLTNAEKLGAWFAGMSIYEIGLRMQVKF